MHGWRRREVHTQARKLLWDNIRDVVKTLTSALNPFRKNIEKYKGVLLGKNLFYERFLPDKKLYQMKKVYPVNNVYLLKTVDLFTFPYVR